MSTDKEKLDALMAADKKLMDDLNAFNQKYAQYMKCNVTNPPTGCTNADKDIQPLTDSQNLVNADILALKDKINSSSLIKTSNYNSNNYDIDAKYSDVTRLRSDLDNKIRELYNLEGTTSREMNLQYDSAMYSGILFTILATIMLYYTFTKL